MHVLSIIFQFYGNILINNIPPIQVNYVDTFQTRFYQSFVNMTEEDSTAYPAITTTLIDTNNPSLTCYNVYDQWALRVKNV